MEWLAMIQSWIIWLIVAALFLVDEVLTTGFFLLVRRRAIVAAPFASLESTVLFRSSPFWRFRFSSSLHPGQSSRDFQTGGGAISRRESRR